jgi:predicted anti-sigma-YlaC factor YlaD
MQCKTFQQQLPAYLDETLAEPERSAWRQHLAGCGECREWAIEQEPTLIFAGGVPTTGASVNPVRIEACVSAVTALIRHDRLAHRMPSRAQRARPWLAAAAAVLIMITGGMLWLQGPSGVTPMAENTEVAAEPEPVTPPPKVEVDMEGAGVRVYHFATTEDDSTAATFIVNPALEL